MKNKTSDAADFQFPKIAGIILKALIPANDFRYTIGVYEQSYLDIKRQKGKFSAHLWLFLQLCLAIPSFLKMKWAGGMAMIKNYIKASFRTIRRKKIYSLVNIIGLSLGFACCILTYVYVEHELSYDRFHENGDSLFRLVRIDHNPDGSLSSRHPNFFSAGLRHCVYGNIRLNIEIWIFVLCGVLSLLTALLTVSYQSVKTATADPVDSLRYE